MRAWRSALLDQVGRRHRQTRDRWERATLVAIAAALALSLVASAVVAVTGG